MTAILRDLFGVNKPVIAMAHFPALPGTPRYDPTQGVEGIIEHMRRRFIAAADAVEVDWLGNVIARVGPAEGHPRIMVFAHI